MYGTKGVLEMAYGVRTIIKIQSAVPKRRSASTKQNMESGGLHFSFTETQHLMILGACDRVRNKSRSVTNESIRIHHGMYR